MSGYLTPVSSMFLLDALVGGELPFSAPRSVYVGLATSVPETNNKTLDNITEVSTAGYERVEVYWDAATVDNIDSGPVQVYNSVDTDFPAMSEDMAPASYAFLTDAASGTSGDILYVWELAEPISALAGKPIRIPAHGLVIE